MAAQICADLCPGDSEGSDPQKGPAGYSGGLSLQRAAGRREAGQPPAEGEILFVVGPRLAGTAANAAAWLLVGRPPSEQNPEPRLY